MNRAPQLLLGALLSLSAGPGAAKELSGVRLPDTVALEGKTLVLNGMGVRTQSIFKLFVAGLYVEAPSHDGASLAQSSQAKRIEVRALRDLEPQKIAGPLRAGIERHAGDKLPAMQRRIETFVKAIPSLKRGEALVLSYVPEMGTFVEHGEARELIEGEDFASALFSTWIGRTSFDGKLRRELLGGR